MAKPAALSQEQIRIADEWYAYNRIPFKTMAAKFGVSRVTLRDAVMRRRAYRTTPR